MLILPEEEAELEKSYVKIKKKQKTMKIMLLIMLSAMLIILLVFAVNYRKEITYSTFEDEIIEEQKQEVVSFQEQINNRNRLDRKEGNLKGFLGAFTIGSGNAVIKQYSIVDDKGKKVFLTSLDKEQKSLFPMNNLTSSLFAVHGTYSSRLDGLYMDVFLIEDAKRQNETIRKTVTKEHVHKENYTILQVIFS